MHSIYIYTIIVHAEWPGVVCYLPRTLTKKIWAGTMGLCFCCLSEEERITRVMAHFRPVLVSQAKAGGDVQKVVGRITMPPGKAPLAAPLSSRPCAYYEVKVEQWTDADGDAGSSALGSWDVIASESKSVNFMLQDDAGGSAFVTSLTRKPIPFATMNKKQ